MNISEFNFYQDNNKRKHKLILIEINKNISDRVVDLLSYNNHLALNKKIKLILGKQNKNFICRRCLKSYTSEIMLINHKEKCGETDICTIRTPSDSHLHWKNDFHKTPLYLRYTKISKQITKLTTLVYVIRQLIFINKTQYLMVII